MLGFCPAPPLPSFLGRHPAKSYQGATRLSLSFGFHRPDLGSPTWPEGRPLASQGYLSFIPWRSPWPLKRAQSWSSKPVSKDGNPDSEVIASDVNLVFSFTGWKMVMTHQTRECVWCWVGSEEMSVLFLVLFLGFHQKQVGPTQSPCWPSHLTHWKFPSAIGSVQ